jgi:hypothetical protein
MCRVSAGNFSIYNFAWGLPKATKNNILYLTIENEPITRMIATQRIDRLDPKF